MQKILSHWKSNWKHTCQWARPSFCPKFSSPFVNKMAPSTKRVHKAASSEVFNATCMAKEVWLTFLRITSSPSPERFLLPNERISWKVWRLPPAHPTSTFSVVISRRSQGWIRTNRWAIKPQIVIKIRCTFGHFLEIFHWACMKRTVILSSFIDEVCTKLDFAREYFCPVWTGV